MTLPDDVFQAARTLGDLKGISLGDALAELARRGLRATAPVDTSKAFPCFAIPSDTDPITLEQTLAAEGEL